MRNIEEKRISENFIDKCKNDSLSNESCIMGIIILTISFIPLFFNIYAFAKMTMFYKKLNFENSIILISAIEIIILEFALTTSLDFFLQLFFFIQILIVSLLIKKFSNLIKEINSIFKKNIFFFLINAINLIIFISYIISIIASGNNILIINFIYKIFYFISTCILSYTCIFMNKLISEHKREYLENYNSFFDLNILNIDSDDLSGIGSITNDYTTQNDDKSRDSNIENKEINKRTEVFYRIKKKQNKCLYVINLLCSSIELTFTIIRCFILHGDFIEDKYKIIPITVESEIFYYIYIFICFVNVGVIFFCFYYYIRRQYSRNPKVYKRRLSKKLFDDDFVEQQKMQDDNLRTNENIISEKKKIRKRSSNDQNFNFIEEV